MMFTTYRCVSSVTAQKEEPTMAMTTCRVNGFRRVDHKVDVFMLVDADEDPSSSQRRLLVTNTVSQPA
jgi:hypothetical protein